MFLNHFFFLAAVILSLLIGLSSAQSTITGPTVLSGAPTATTAPPTAATAGTGTTTNKIIAVVVGSPTLNKSLVFTPNEITAKPGDIIQFQFSQFNHTVTQSSFAAPCEPIQQSDASAAGIHSGFVPGGPAGSTTVQTFDMPINDTKPMFLYCAQGPHCVLGMVMAINVNNGTESFAAYKAASAKATKNVPATNFKGGVLGNIPVADAIAPPV